MTLITEEYRVLNTQLHDDDDEYGRGARFYIEIVKDLARVTNSQDILDYGCGKSSLSELLGYPIHEYDPAIPGKEAPPAPADIVVCACVLEHIEPDCVDDVVRDLRRCTKQYGLFVIPHTPAAHHLADGRNAHLNVHPKEWWDAKLTEVGFYIWLAKEVGSITSIVTGEIIIGTRTYYVVGPA